MVCDCSEIKTCLGLYFHSRPIRLPPSCVCVDPSASLADGTPQKGFYPDRGFIPVQDYGDDRYSQLSCFVKSTSQSRQISQSLGYGGSLIGAHGRSQYLGGCFKRRHSILAM